MRKVLTVVGVAACLWIASPDAQAAPILRLSHTGFAVLDVADGSGMDADAAANIIEFDGPYGTFEFTFLGGASNSPGSTVGTLEIGTFRAKNISNTAQTLTVWLTDTNFNAPGLVGDVLSLTSSVGSASVMANSSVVFESFVDAGNVAFAETLATGAVTCVPGPSCSGDTTVYFARPLLYSLTNQTDLTVAAGQTLSFDGLTTSAVPEPGSMLLFGTGLMGLAGAARRRMRNRGSQQ